MTRFFTTASALGVSAVLAGCASAPNFPINPEPGPPPLPVQAYPDLDGPYSQGAPRAVPTQRIQSGVLPPPGPREPAPTAVALPPIAEPPPAYVPEPPALPPALPPAPKPAPRPQASGKVTTDAPPPVKVEKGDTLIGISRKTGVLVAVLARTNDLKEPYTVRPGQTIKLPAKRYYTVLPGDTLYAVARRFTVEAAALAEFNEITLSSSIRAGQKIYLPADAKDKGPPPIPKPAPVIAPPPRPQVAAAPPIVPPPPRAPTPGPEPEPEPEPEPAPPTPRAPIPYRATNPTPQQPQTLPAPRPATPEASAPPSESQITAAGRGKFVWPVRGDVLSRFGPTGGGQRNDGVNIAARPSEPVRAAAQGEVVYAGNQVPGFGNLVLIKHSGGWVTAYAHLAKIDVKMRQAIAQGQAIGEAGQTGTVDQPQLHFEVRYAPSPQDKARPVDPMLVLPR